MKSRLGILVIIGMLIGSVLTGLAIASAIHHDRKAIILANEQEDANLFIRNLEVILSNVHELVEGCRAYTISGDAEFLEGYKKAIIQIPAAELRLKDFVRRNPEFGASVDSLGLFTLQLSAFGSQVIDARNAGDVASATKQISTKKGEGLKNEVTYGISSLISQAEVKLRQLENQRNQLSRRSSNSNFLFAVISIVLMAFVFFLVKKELSRKKVMEDMIKSNAERLSEEVRIKTSELNEILYRITDGFASLDNDWTVTYINHRACDIFHLDYDKTIGRNIWHLFPEGIGGTFQKAYQQAKTEQKPLVIEQFYAVLGIWVRIHIYPSPNGLSLFVEDTTDIKTSVKILEESERKFRQLIEELPKAIYTCDAEGKINLYNKAAVKLWGRSPEIGKEMWCGSFKLYDMELEPLPNDICPMAMCIKENIISVGQEIIVERPDGSRKFIIAHPTPLRDVSGALIGAVNVLIDITERKKAEQIIQKASSELAEAQRLAKCGNWVLDIVPGILTWSDELYHIFDVEKGPMALKHLDFLGLVDEIDRELAYQTSLRAQTEGVSFDIEYHITTSKKRKLVIHELGYAERNEDGNIIRLFGTAQDITERVKNEFELKKSEQNYRYLFNNNPAVIFIWDPINLKILEVNDTATNEYGYTHDEFVNMSILDLRPAEDKEKVRMYITEILSGSIIKSKAIWRHFKKNGDTMFMHITPHIITYNEQPAVLALAENVSDKFLLEEQLRKSYDDITLLNTHLQNIREKERTDIARDIHDELGQQLTALKMDASWLNKKINPVDEAVSKKITRMIALIDQTVNSVRRIASDLRPGILDTLGLEAALEWQSEDFEQRTGIKCRIQFECPENCLFERDYSTCVFRVYQETLTNIMRHAKATEVKTKIEILNGQFTLWVKDNGIGFSIGNLENNSSLGLIGMKERAKVFGGKVIVESGIGKGTILELRLPFTQ